MYKYIVMCISVTQSCLTLCDLLDYIAHQAPLSMGFSRKEYWSGLWCFLQGIFPTQVPNLIAGRFFTAEPPRKPYYAVHSTKIT